MDSTQTNASVLIVEDDDALRQNLLLLLRLEGYRVRGAANGRDALSLLRERRDDLVLCDVLMPGMDGHALLEAVRGDPALAGIPFIFMTARGERSDVRRGMDLGADDYLVKPCNRDELLSAVAARLRRRGGANAAFAPDFSSPAPLLALGVTAREAEVLLWLAQGKRNAEIGEILGASEATVKKHVMHLFLKLGVESRNAAALRALEVLSRSRPV